jgi:hypothetical protein
MLEVSDSLTCDKHRSSTSLTCHRTSSRKTSPLDLPPMNSSRRVFFLVRISHACQWPSADVNSIRGARQAAPVECVFVDAMKGRDRVGRSRYTIP